MENKITPVFRPAVLSIAGFDPSGGAGISADQRVIESCGCAPLSAIAVQTVQNTQGMTEASATGPTLLENQLVALFDDIEVSAVKVGALGSADNVRVVVSILKRYGAKNIVVDPVLASTGGSSLIDIDAVDALLNRLIPICDLVTPNLDEMKRLTGHDIENSLEAESAASELFDYGAKAVLVKGGHMNGDPVDALYTRTGSPVAIRHPRIETIHTHGTGCFLSSAIASFLSNGFELEESVRIAIAHLTSALYTPVSIGKGRGYPAPVRGISTRMRRENRVSGIYFVTSDEFGCSHEESALAALAGGVKVIQFRAKNMDTAQMIRVASKINAHCKESGAVFIVNDRVDVALASGADGAHVGADDMAASKAREIMGPDAIIGASVATLDDAALAAPYVSHFGVGPVFGTSTKLDAGAAIGLERVSEIKKAFPNIPLIAIGGIGAEQIAPVKHAGADSAAVISAIAGASDRAQAARNLVKLWGEGQH